MRNKRGNGERGKRVESDGGEYYIVDEPKISLSGLLVRVRG